LIGQLIAEASIEGTEEYSRDVYDEYVERRKCLIDGVNRILPVRFGKPGNRVYLRKVVVGCRIRLTSGSWLRSWAALRDGLMVIGACDW